VYKCQVNKAKDDQPKELCGIEVPAGNFNTSGLRVHVRDHHPKQFSVVEGTAEQQANRSIAAQLGIQSQLDNQQKDKITLTWARNGLQYCLIDEPTYRDTFKSNIPKGFDRHDMSANTQRMQERDEAQLFGEHKKHNVFLMVDGGTLNRKRHLNASLGLAGQTYFHRQGWKYESCLSNATNAWFVPRTSRAYLPHRFVAFTIRCAVPPLAILPARG
jgi:hypothetical protein